MLNQSPDGEIVRRERNTEPPPRPMPFLPAALTMHGLPRVADDVMRRFPVAHAKVIHVTDTAIVVAAWNPGDPTVRTFQVNLRFAANDPSLAIDYDDVREVRYLTTRQIRPVVRKLMTIVSVVVTVLWYCYTRNWRRLGAVIRFATAALAPDTYRRTREALASILFLKCRTQVLEGNKIVLYTKGEMTIEFIPYLREAVLLYAPKDPRFDFDSAFVENMTATSATIACLNSKRGLPGGIRRFSVELPTFSSEVPNPESIVIDELPYLDQLTSWSFQDEIRRPGPISVVSVHVTPDDGLPSAQFQSKVDAWVRTADFNRIALCFRGAEVFANAWRDDLLGFGRVKNVAPDLWNHITSGRHLMERTQV